MAIQSSRWSEWIAGRNVILQPGGSINIVPQQHASAVLCFSDTAPCSKLQDQFDDSSHLEDLYALAHFGALSNEWPMTEPEDQDTTWTLTTPLRLSILAKCDSRNQLPVRRKDGHDL